MQDYYRILDPVWGTRRGPMRRPATPDSGRARRQRSTWSDGFREERIEAARVQPSSDGRWFGDEVGIDFPSASAAIERVRRGFDDEERGPVAATSVALTGLEGQRGGRIPVRLCLPATCGACGGRGESWGAPCERCAGQGSAPRWRYLVLNMPPGLRDGDSLQFRLRDPNAPARVVVQVSVR